MFWHAFCHKKFKERWRDFKRSLMKSRDSDEKGASASLMIGQQKKGMITYL